MQATITKPLEWKTSLLSSGFTGDLITPNDPQYEASLIRLAKNAQKQAGLVAFVKSSEDVSNVIKHATANGIEIVIRSGGHSTSGASSTEGGIVIDLSRHLNSVRIEEENKLGYVGGGATWAKVDAEAIKYGLATVAGTVNHTGVGGCVRHFNTLCF
jgi:FAD/FMN-containing dehydrogenase